MISDDLQKLESKKKDKKLPDINNHTSNPLSLHQINSSPKQLKY